jgi:hypothetical protein
MCLSKLRMNVKKLKVLIKSFPLTLTLSLQGREDKNKFLSLDGRGLR